MVRIDTVLLKQIVRKDPIEKGMINLTMVERGGISFEEVTY